MIDLAAIRARMQDEWGAEDENIEAPFDRAKSDIAILLAEIERLMERIRRMES